MQGVAQQVDRCGHLERRRHGLARPAELVEQAAELPEPLAGLAHLRARLAEIPRVVGVKEAAGSMPQALDILHLCGPDFAVWSGDDVITLPLMASGAVGVISVTSNVAPKPMVELADAIRAGDLVRARRVHARLMPLFRDLFLEVNPIPVKTALAIMGGCTGELRLPLTPMTPANRTTLERTLREQGLV